jgi:hypothetical protein
MPRARKSLIQCSVRSAQPPEAVRFRRRMFGNGRRFFSIHRLPQHYEAENSSLEMLYTEACYGA